MAWVRYFRFSWQILKKDRPTSTSSSSSCYMAKFVLALFKNSMTYDRRKKLSEAPLRMGLMNLYIKPNRLSRGGKKVMIRCPLGFWGCLLAKNKGFWRFQHQ